jgi:hypothetical protein
MVPVVLPLSPRDAVNYGSFHFPGGFQNAEPEPVSHPDLRVERGAGRHNALWKTTGGGRLGEVAEGVNVMENRLSLLAHSSCCRISGVLFLTTG